MAQLSLNYQKALVKKLIIVCRNLKGNYYSITSVIIIEYWSKGEPATMLLGIMTMPRRFRRHATESADIRLYPLISRGLKKLLFRLSSHNRSLPTTNQSAFSKNQTATRVPLGLLNLAYQMQKSSSKYFWRVIFPTVGDIIGYDLMLWDMPGGRGTKGRIPTCA